jgi:hypothetical protein
LIIVYDGMSILAARGRFEMEVTSPFDRSTTVSLLVFDTHYLSSRHRSEVIFVCWIFNYGEMEISSARSIEDRK